MPEQPPFVGEEFDAYIFVKARTPFQACEGETPDSDVIRVQWDIYNGPTASVEVEDMKATASQSVESTSADDRQQWSIMEWQNTCSKINTMGCDVLTVKIEKIWKDWDDQEDVDFNGKQFDISLITELNSVEKNYGTKTHSFGRAFDDVPCSGAMSLLSIGGSLLLGAALMLY